MAPTPRVRRAAPRGWLPLAALVAVSAGLRTWGALSVPVPWIPVDETLYAKLGTSLWSHGRLELLGEATGVYTLVYPALAGLPLALGGLDSGYDALKVLQAVTLSLTAVPAFLWTRSLAGPRWALLAAALTLAAPGLAYAGLVLTEVAFYPVLILAAWASARALAVPTPGRQALAVAAVLVACATRLQAVVLLPALATAAVLLALAERRRAPLVRLWPTWAGFALLAGLWSLWRLARGVPLLGAYQAAAETSYGLEDSAVAVVRHAGDLVLLTAVVPLVATVLLAVEALRREAAAELRAYAAVAVSFSAWIVVQVGIFASRNVGYIAERNLTALGPIAFVGFAVWLGRGAPKPRFATPVASLLAVGAVLTIPLDSFLSGGQLPFSFTASALWRHLADASLETQQVVVFGAAAVGAALASLVPRRLAPASAAVVLVVLAVLSVEASRMLVNRSETQQTRFLGPVRRWVDEARAGPSFYLYDGDRDADAVWENLFWNESIQRVYDLPLTEVLGPLPQKVVRVDPDGRILTVDGVRPVGDAAVASTRFAFVGEQVAEAPQSLPGQTGLRLWRLAGEPRLSSMAEGFAPNGDVYPGKTATVTVYDCAGSLALTLLVKGAHDITIRRDGRIWKRVRFENGPEYWNASVPAPPGRAGRSCVFQLSSGWLFGSTLVRFDRV